MRTLLFFNILHPNTTFLCSFVVLTDIFYYICKQLGLEVYGVRGLWGLLDYFLLYGMMQSKKNPWNAGNLFSLLIVCASINISEIISQIYLAQNLHQRSIRYFKKVCLLLCRNTAHALCDIRRNRRTALRNWSHSAYCSSLGNAPTAFDTRFLQELEHKHKRQASQTKKLFFPP